MLLGGVFGLTLPRGFGGLCIGGTAGGAVTNLVQVYDAGSDSWQLATPLPVAVPLLVRVELPFSCTARPNEMRASSETLLLPTRGEST